MIQIVALPETEYPLAGTSAGAAEDLDGGGPHQVQAKARSGFGEAKAVVFARDDFSGVILSEVGTEKQRVFGRGNRRMDAGDFRKEGPRFFPEAGESLWEQGGKGDEAFAQEDAGLEFEVLQIEAEKRHPIGGIDGDDAGIGAETIAQRAIAKQTAERSLEIKRGRRVAGGGRVHRPWRWHRGNRRRARG